MLQQDYMTGQWYDDGQGDSGAWDPTPAAAPAAPQAPQSGTPPPNAGPAPPEYWIPPNASFDPGNPSGQINLQNPYANPNQPFVQAGTTGGYLDGIGVTIGQGRSLTPEQYQAAYTSAIASGVPEAWAADYLKRNPLDANRIGEAYRSDTAQRGSGTGSRWSNGGYGGGGGNRPTFNFTGAPGFNFKAPSLEEAQADPGYEFARAQGQRGLEQSAAGRGLLRTGGTLKDLASWNQNFATQNYGNVYDRRFKEAQASFAPQFEDWRLKNLAERDAGLAAYTQDFDRYRFDTTGAFDLYRYNGDNDYRYNQLLYGNPYALAG